MARWPVVVLLCCLVTAMAGAPVAAATGAQPGVGLGLNQQFDRAEFRIAVFPNGSARWTFRYERTLANDTERRQFESFATSFNTNETRLFTDFRNQSRTLVRRGTNATDREMAARSFARRAFVSTQLNEVGVVAMAFTWTGFAQSDGERVVVGDVFEGGLYLGPDQSLVVRAAEGLQFRSVEPSGTLSGGTLAASDTVTWTGERTFTDNRPRVVLVPPQPAGSPATTATDGDDGPTAVTTTTPATSSGPLWPVAFVGVVIAAALGVFLYRRRQGPPASPGPDAEQTQPSTTLDEAALMDDEDRIEGLLEEHGGRMRQSELVEATGWSKSKVSMVLSEMAEADRVRKLRVGRENLVSLPGHEPDAVGSPHDDGDGGGKS